MKTRLCNTQRCSSARLDKFRTLYGSDVVTRVQNHGILVTADYANHEGAISHSVDTGDRDL